MTEGRSLGEETLDLRLVGGRLAGAEGIPFGTEMDIGIRGGRITAIGELFAVPARATIPMGGLFVSPGWIDLHVHLWRPALAVDPDRDAGMEHGVTTVVDAGPVGAREIDAYLERVASRARTRVLLFVNVSDDTSEVPIHGRAGNLDAKATARAVADHPYRALGVKVMASQSHVGALGAEPVRVALEAAARSGSRVMCHIGHAPPDLGEVLDLLAEVGERAIVTHALHGKPGGLLDRAGRVIPQAREADARGVRWDLGHGSASFAYETARAAFAAGFEIDTISTDLHRGNVRGPVRDLATTMTKLLALGVPLEAVVDKVTRRAAEAIGREDGLGRIALGREADLTLFRVVDMDGDVAGAGSAFEGTLVDSEGAKLRAATRILPVGVVREGKYHALTAVDPFSSG